MNISNSSIFLLKMNLFVTLLDFSHFIELWLMMDDSAQVEGKIKKL